MSYVPGTSDIGAFQAPALSVVSTVTGTLLSPRTGTPPTAPVRENSTRAWTVCLPVVMDEHALARSFPFTNTCVMNGLRDGRSTFFWRLPSRIPVCIERND